jgi:hypothetical protein
MAERNETSELIAGCRAPAAVTVVAGRGPGDHRGESESGRTECLGNHWRLRVSKQDGMIFSSSESDSESESRVPGGPTGKLVTGMSVSDDTRLLNWPGFCLHKTRTQTRNTSSKKIEVLACQAEYLLRGSGLKSRSL